MTPDLALIFVCWMLLLLWQLIGFTIGFWFYGQKSKDAAWGFGRLITWLVVSLTIWFLGHFKIPVNQQIFIYLFIFGLAVWSILFIKQRQNQVKQFLKNNWKIILTQEFIFLFFFFFLPIIRGFNPAIEGLEKFMDVGFIAGYLRSPTLPAQDMWLAGFNINYYTFGHFMGAIVTQFWNIGVDYSYNLLLGLIMGLVAINAFSFVYNFVSEIFDLRGKKITQKKAKLGTSTAIKAALIAVFLLSFSGNGHPTWYLFTNQSFEGYWYPNATRFIENTIHEFPAYSYIVSDLHAHVWGLPIVIFILFNIFLWLKVLLKTRVKKVRLTQIIKQKYFPQATVLGLLLGIAISTSTWDFFVYGLLMVIISSIILVINYKLFYHLLFSALIILITALLTTSPWLLNFESISEGIKVVTERSPYWQLVVLWGPHLLVSFITGAIAFKFLKKRKKLTPESIFLLAMAIVSLILITLPEIIYVKDIYPNHPRANTMFKLTFQSFILMTFLASFLSSLIAWTRFKKKLPVYQQFLFKGVLVVFIMSVGYYAFFGYRDFYLNLKNYQGLNGLAWLKEQEADDYLAIDWLRNNVQGRPVILEAVGESYTTYARVSTFTGLPTVLGWRVHQWLWRGSFDIPGQRTEEVRAMYEQPDLLSSQQLIQNYNLKYIFIGSKEREAYQFLDESGLSDLGQEVFRAGDTYILKL